MSFTHLARFYTKVSIAIVDMVMKKGSDLIITARQGSVQQTQNFASSASWDKFYVSLYKSQQACTLEKQYAGDSSVICGLPFTDTLAFSNCNVPMLMQIVIKANILSKMVLLELQPL